MSRGWLPPLLPAVARRTSALLMVLLLVVSGAVAAAASLRCPLRPPCWTCGWLARDAQRLVACRLLEELLLL